jgi:DNA primase
MIPDHIKEEVKAATDIVEVVSDYVKLRRSGSNFMGLCPFHNEKSPSFNVSPQIGIYKCFGCGESGDVFSFVMKMDGISFTEAIRTLGARFGVDVPEEQRPEQDEQYRLKEGIYHALAFAGKFFYSQLVESPEALSARKYLDERGFSAKTVRKYGLGFAPTSYDGLLKAAREAKINEQYLEQAGLIKYGRNGESAYDVFRNRIMFPIFNASGKVIAFGGRIMPGTAKGDQPKGPKYINSPQTLVYNKSEVLYGIHVAKNEIRKAGEVILVEGYTDVLSMHQAGVGNAVATSGTALTTDQLRAMHRYAETLLMIYDADLAGQNAMTRGIDLALAEGLDVRLLQLPEGEDPDSFVKKQGREAFIKYRNDNAADFLTFMINKAMAAGTWDDPFHRTATVTALLRSIAIIPDEIAQQAFVQRLSGLTNMGTRTLFEQLGVQRAEVRRAREKDRDRERRQFRPDGDFGRDRSSPGVQARDSVAPRSGNRGAGGSGESAGVPGKPAMDQIHHDKRSDVGRNQAENLDSTVPKTTIKSGKPTADTRTDNDRNNTKRSQNPGFQDDIPWPEDDLIGAGRVSAGSSDSPPDYLNIPLPDNHPAGMRPGRELMDVEYQGSTVPSAPRPAYERELLKIMLKHGHPMVEYIGSLCNEDHFENDEYRMMFSDMVARYEEGKPISVSVYSGLSDPYPSLVGEIVMERYTTSSRARQKTGGMPGTDAFKSAKGSLRSLKLSYLDRLKDLFQDRYAQAETTADKKEIQQLLLEVTRERVRFESGMLDELFPDPDSI